MQMLLIGDLTAEQIRIGHDLGFDGYVNILFTPGTEERGEVCGKLGMTQLFLLPAWSREGDIYKVKSLTDDDWAFRNADGESSFNAIGGGMSGNLWPSFWNPDPEILEIARRHFKRAFDFGADGFLITTSIGECKFPCHWGNEHGAGGPEERLRYSYWCHDRHAKRHWPKYIAGIDRQSFQCKIDQYLTEQSADDILDSYTEPDATPLEDQWLLTMDFCQQGMLCRLNQLCNIALDFRQTVIPVIGPWVYPSALLYRTVGYYRLHEKLEVWRQEFAARNGVDPSWWIPAVYNGPQEKIDHAHELVSHWDWSLYAGGQCDGLYGPWDKMFTYTIIEARMHGLSGLICDGREMLSSPENIVKAQQCLAIRS